jgi:hypothetical protein
MMMDKDLCQAPRQEINNWMTAKGSTLQPIKFETAKNIFQPSWLTYLWAELGGLQP